MKMEGLYAVLALAGGIAIGIVLGFLGRSRWGSQQVKAAQAEARRIEAEARARQKDLILEAKEEKIRLQREAEDDARERRAELTNFERRLHARDEQLDQRADMLEQRDRKLLEKVSSMSADDAK